MDSTSRDNWPPACVEKPNQLITYPLLPQKALRGQWVKTTKTAVRSDTQKDGFWRRGTLHRTRGMSSVWGSGKRNRRFWRWPLHHSHNQPIQDRNEPIWTRMCLKQSTEARSADLRGWSAGYGGDKTGQSTETGHWNSLVLLWKGRTCETSR